MTETLPPCPRSDCRETGHHAHWLIGPPTPYLTDHSTYLCEVATDVLTRCYSARCPDCTYADVQELHQSEPVEVLSIPCAEHDSK